MAIVNKVDILMEAGIYRLFHEGELKSFDNLTSFKKYITNFLKISDNHVNKIIFSKHPEII